MTKIHQALHFVFQATLSPLPFSAADWVLLLLSLLTAVFSLLVFKYTSNQPALHLVKNRMKACLLEIRLFKDSPGIILSAQLNLLGWNLRYLALGSRPLLLLLPPLVILMVQMQSWFGWRPLNSGDSARMMAVLRTPDPAGLSSVRLIGDTLALELPPLRILSAKPEINWRLRILGPGQARLLPGDGQESEVFPIAVGPDRFIPVWPERLPGSWWNNLWAAGQPPLPPASAFEKLALEYPEREMSLLGWKMNWIWIFLLETLLFGFLLKGIFKVEF